MRKILLAAVLAGGAWAVQPAVHAAPATWQFTYTGYQADIRRDEWDINQPVVTTTTSEFLPDAVLSGSFTGSDTNGNGAIDLAELTAFSVNGESFFGCAPRDDMIANDCHVDRFSYTPGGQLDVDAGWSKVGEVYWSRDFHLATDTGFEQGGRGRYSMDSQVYRWTGQTQFSISPVPEPASGAMAAAGALLLGALCRRRRAPRLTSRRP